MFDFQVDFGSSRTEVAVRLHLGQQLGQMLAAIGLADPGRRAILISDERVAALHAGSIRTSLQEAGFDPLEYLIAPGEASKSLAVAEKIYRFLAQHAVGRDAIVLAVGGGVVSDLAGFVAATWMRGVDFVICPTTLESDVDACLGGKTAVNIGGAKNLVGAFHQPRLVAVDPAFLKTLDPRDIRAGLAESVKHALIRSEEFLSWHEDHTAEILALDDAIIAELIHRNLRIKADIVERDTKEQTGARMLLNFGHTIGHAIESCAQYALRHGECVSLGMMAACRISQSLNLLDSTTVSRLDTLLERIGLPRTLPTRMDVDELYETMSKDKKVLGGSLRFVLLEAVATPVIRDNVPQQVILDAIDSLQP